MLDKTIAKNISSLFSIRFAGYVIPLLTLPYLVRVLEPVGYGTLAYCLAIVQYFVIIVNFGFDLSITQKISQERDNIKVISKIFWNVTLIRLVSSFIGFLFLLFLCEIIPNLKDVYFVLLSSYISVFAAALFPQWLFQGKEQLGMVSILRVVFQLISVPMLFIFVRDNNDIWKAALITSLPSVAIVFCSVLIIFERKWICWVKPSLSHMMKEVKDGWHLFLSTAAVSLYTTSVTVILGILSGPVSVAIYVSANKLFTAAQGLFSSVSSSFYPRINLLASKCKEEALAMIRYLMKIQFAITVFISCSLFAFSPFVIGLLFGQDYYDSILVLRIISVLPIIIGLSNIFGIHVLLTFGYKKEFSKVLIYTGVLSFFYLFPLCFFYSYVGAAISVVITEVLVTSWMYLIVKQKKINIF